MIEESIHVLLATEKADTVLHSTWDSEPGLCGLNHLYGPNLPTPSA